VAGFPTESVGTHKARKPGATGAVKEFASVEMAHLSNSLSESLEPPGPRRIYGCAFRQCGQACGQEAETGRA